MTDPLAPYPWAYVLILPEIRVCRSLGRPHPRSAAGLGV